MSSLCGWWSVLEDPRSLVTRDGELGEAEGARRADRASRAPYFNLPLWVRAEGRTIGSCSYHHLEVVKSSMARAKIVWAVGSLAHCHHLYTTVASSPAGEIASSSCTRIFASSCRPLCMFFLVVGGICNGQSKILKY